MDPVQYEKIADKLMQFRGKMPDTHVLSSTLARIHNDKLKKQIDELLLQIDYHAEMNQRGLIR